MLTKIAAIIVALSLTFVPLASVSSFHWNKSRVTFYDYNTWGWNRPGGGNGIFACGGKYLRSSIGVAHRTLPCGTIIRLCYNRICVNAPVVDRGPYSKSLVFDLTSEACLRIKHCFTGPVSWRIVR